MSAIVKNTETQLKSAIAAAVEAAIAAGELVQADLPAFVIEVPGDRSHGDLATNVAMVSAKAFRSAPRKIAESITDSILQNKFIDSWNGELPMVSGSDGNLINIPLGTDEG